MIGNKKGYIYVFGLLMLAPTIITIGQLRDNNRKEALIDSKVQSLLTQGEIIAAAISSSAHVESGAITLDPERLTTVTPSQSMHPQNDNSQALEFSMNPNRVGPLIKRLINPSKLVVRVYDKDGYILIDTRSPGGSSNILQNELPDLQTKNSDIDILQTISNYLSILSRKLQGENLPSYKDIGTENGKLYPEVDNALQGYPGAIVRRDDSGALIISVAVPVKRSRYVRGAMLLTQKSNDLDEVVQNSHNLVIFYYLGVIILCGLLATAMPKPVDR